MGLSEDETDRNDKSIVGRSDKNIMERNDKNILSI